MLPQANKEVQYDRKRTRAPGQIRRFDIFAEWNRLKARSRHHMSAADARAYGLAVAKVVASRKFHGTTPDQAKEPKHRARNDDVSEQWWEHLGSDDEFEQKIIRRMGKHSTAMSFSRRFSTPGMPTNRTKTFAIPCERMERPALNDTGYAVARV